MGANSRQHSTDDTSSRRRPIEPLRPKESRQMGAGGVQAAQSETMLETISDGLLGVSRDWRYTYANSAAAKFLRRPVDDLLNRHVFEVFPDAKGTAFEEGLRQALEQGVATAFEAHYPPLDAWFECRCYPAPEGISILFTDTTQRKRDEQTIQALREQAQRVAEQFKWLARFPEENPNPVLRVSFDGEVEYRNPATAKTAGWACEAGDPLPGPLRPLFDRAMAERLEVQDDVQLAEKVYSVSIVPVTDECYANVYGRDVTERKHAEEALRRSEDRFREIFENAAMGIAITDWQGRFQQCNPAYCALLGYSEQELHQVDFALLVHPEDRDASLAQIRRLQAGELPFFQTEYRCICKDGRLVWVHKFVSVLPDATGRPAHLVALVTDVTERRQMEEQLQQMNDRLGKEVQAQTEELGDVIDRLQDEVASRVLAERRLRKSSQMLEGFFKHTITPLAFLDKHFNFIRVNEAYARAGGKTCDYFVGKNHFALYPHEENQAIFEQVVRTKQPYVALTKPFTYPDDPQRMTYWNWQVTPLLNDVGEVQFLVFNLQDVTQQQTAMLELERRARQLQRLTLELSQAEDRERRRLAQILHDDLQQILAGAKFHLGMLSGRVKGNPPAEELIEQMNAILKEAIETSRSLSHELSPAVLYHNDLGETFEWLSRHMEAKHGLAVHLEVRGQIESQSEPLKAFLYRAAQEVLFNVVKHAGVKEARLRLQRVRDDLWVTISDRGQGFDPKVPAGTGGYGLMSIRERVELLGGRMKIRSAEGRGSTFLIVVPGDRIATKTGTSVELAGERRPRVRKRKKRGDGSCLRVLLVDDHKVMREGLAALLDEQQNITVVGQAENGRDAVALALELQPDVVVMDIAMPVMGGDEATRQIKLHLPKTRVVALSMFEKGEMAEKMRRAGAETYLLKTAPSEELLAAIHNAKG